jgi:hypothetical protein
VARPKTNLAAIIGLLAEIDGSTLANLTGLAGPGFARKGTGGSIVSRHWFGILCVAGVVGMLAPAGSAAQTEQPGGAPHGPYARIAIMRALDGHGVEFEQGYIRHLQWHRDAKDAFNWYSYSVWASSERQRWIIYATFGHTAAELSNPVAPLEDERDNLMNVLPHSLFLGNWIYEFLPALSRGNGMPTPMARAEYTTVEVNLGQGKAFESALAAEQSKLEGETLWYRLVVGGSPPRYVRLRPRATLGAILDERATQPLPEKVNGLVSHVTVETLNLRPTMLVNVTPAP